MSTSASPTAQEKPSVLFVCTHNSARSQMAEGLLRDRWGDQYQVYSAGTERTHVRPHAIAALKEQGIDISDHISKTVGDLDAEAFDYVVTVCDNARDNCPYVPARRANVHHSFDDPSRVEGSDDEKMDAFRRVRNEIDDWIERQFDPNVQPAG